MASFGGKDPQIQKGKKESSYTRTTFTTKRENMTNLGGDKKGTLIFKNEKDKS